MVEKRNILGLFLFGLIMAITADLHARPVSYKGGTTLMLKNDHDANVAHLHYSPTVNYSIGYRVEYQRDKEYWLHMGQLNNLVKRWNNPDSQANIYLKSGLGVATGYKNNNQSYNEQAAFFTGIAMDWENRRYFISYENRYLNAQDIDKQFRQSARLGVAPYIGEYGDVHTWLMLEASHNPKMSKKYVLTPMVRLFHGPNLGEIGFSTEKTLLFNYTRRF